VESNWRFNVWDQGMVYGGISLAARLLGVPGAFVVKWDFAPGGAACYIGINPFSGTWGLVGPFVFLSGRFPFGEVVEPDS